MSPESAADQVDELIGRLSRPGEMTAEEYREMLMDLLDRIQARLAAAKGE